MNVLRRLLGRRRSLPADIAAWREDWLRATNELTLDPAVIDGLRSRLPSLSEQEDLEVEREMLEGLEEAVALTATIGDRGLPVVTTGHRVVGTDICHFSAPASMPDEAAQPSGRLLLTSGRAIFAGTGRALTAPWHALTRPTQSDRDVVLIRVDGSMLYRFRCNSYADALSAAIIARQLVRSRRK